MWRLLLFLSIFPLVLALAVRWWFGLRVLAREGRRLCRADGARWARLPGAIGGMVAGEESAREHGARLREAALAAWRERAPKAAAAREGSKRFGMAVPPLTAMVAVFAVLVAKIPLTGGIAIILAATALAAALRLLGLGGELRAVAAEVNAMRDLRVFPRLDDEEAVAASAVAEAWNDAVPPVLRLLQP
jgi:hypothetical protein